MAGFVLVFEPEAHHTSHRRAAFLFFSVGGVSPT
jgi:hypothetical protein